MEKIAYLPGISEFVASAKTGSFSGAARALGVSVAHISRTVAKLEADLGVQLITRSTRSSILTDQGQQFFSRCSSILEAYDEARDIARAATAISGRIRISMGGHYAETVLTPQLARFCADHPGVSIDLEMTSRNVAMIEENFDLAVRAGPLAQSTLIARKHAGFRLRTLAAPGHVPDAIEDPGDLHPSSCMSLGGRDWVFSRKGEIRVLKPEGRVNTNSGTLLVSSAIERCGIAQVPSYYGQAELESGRLVELFPEWTASEEFEFFLVYPEQRHLPARVRALIDYLVAQAGR
ncbi:LysR family transcriptional regulator [Neorhizobium alkalisoli]|uniref:HTH-type transcriptional regulator TtuA n=1 Tax=Neorhizobium alkalisoli TaxID=528178 RepID=A0A561QB21_9HYPH|nr:LysR family transcriptional regulator [Neorhizobium alkalisoli]TWF47541.1 transcriptional regulator [Neorhizobium alkalisoli]